MEGNSDYLLTEEGQLEGVKHFAVWPLAQAAASCFGEEQWPTEHPIPQGWIEYEVQDLDGATRVLSEKAIGCWWLTARTVGANRHFACSARRLAYRLTITPWLRGKWEFVCDAGCRRAYHSEVGHLIRS